MHGDEERHGGPFVVGGGRGRSGILSGPHEHPLAPQAGRTSPSTAAAARRPETSAPWIDAVSRWSPATWTPDGAVTGRRRSSGGRWLGQRPGDHRGGHQLPAGGVGPVDHSGAARRAARSASAVPSAPSTVLATSARPGGRVRRRHGGHHRGVDHRAAAVGVQVQQPALSPGGSGAVCQKVVRAFMAGAGTPVSRSAVGGSVATTTARAPHGAAVGVDGVGVDAVHGRAQPDRAGRQPGRHHLGQPADPERGDGGRAQDERAQQQAHEGGGGGAVALGQHAREERLDDAGPERAGDAGAVQRLAERPVRPAGRSGPPAAARWRPSGRRAPCRAGSPAAR